MNGWRNEWMASLVLVCNEWMDEGMTSWVWFVMNEWMNEWLVYYWFVVMKWMNA